MVDDKSYFEHNVPQLSNVINLFLAEAAKHM